LAWPVALGILFAMLLVGLSSGFPVAFTFMAINIVGLYAFVGGANALTLLAGSAFDSVANFALSPIPLFILMGEVLLRSGLATLCVDAVDVWVGRLPGRLAFVAVGGGTIFGALSGSSMAATAMLGSTMAAEMEQRGYKPQMSVASILAAGGLDVLIPPSALGVLLAVLANVSAGKLLIAAVVPGLILATIYAIYFIGRARLQPYLAPPYEVAGLSLRARLATLKHLVPLSGLMVVVTGFIFFGIATPSETAAMGAVASAMLAAAYGKLGWNVIRISILATVQTSAMVFLIIVGSKAYSQLMAITGAATGFVEWVTSLPLTPILMVIGMNLIVMVLGCFIDQLSIMLITVPIFMPIVANLGLDPLWFSVILLVNLELAGITPPFGLQLFVMKGVRPQLKMTEIYVAALPIIVLQSLLIGLMLAFPPVSTWLPGLMFQR
jgi:tripartite ATP-independent transporter DctM subunit